MRILLIKKKNDLEDLDTGILAFVIARFAVKLAEGGLGAQGGALTTGF